MISYQEYEEHMLLIVQKMLNPKGTINKNNFLIDLEHIQKSENEKCTNIKKNFILLLNRDKQFASDIAISGYYLATCNFEKKLIEIINNFQDLSVLLETHKDLSFLKNDKIKESILFLKNKQKEKRGVECLFYNQILVKELVMLKNYAEIFKLKFGVNDEVKQ